MRLTGFYLSLRLTSCSAPNGAHSWTETLQSERGSTLYNIKTYNPKFIPHESN
jgi:hypothetical protein